MHDGLKIAIGGGVTVLLAWALHGPLGQGEAFLAALKGKAQARLAQHDLAGLQVDFTDSPLSRRVHLNGPASPAQRADAIKLMRTLPGADGAVWGSGRAPALAQAKPTTAPAPAATHRDEPLPKPAVTPAPAPHPGPKSTPKPAATAQPTPVPAASPAPAGSCQAAVDAAVGGRVMSFRSGSAWLNPTSLAIIRDVAAALKRCTDYEVEIAGHTDNVGDEGINRIMSEERAKRVRGALVDRGVPADRLSAKGYGSSRPIRAGDAADPANRRISFTVTGGGA